MPRVEETIPNELAAEAEAARIWLNRERNTDFTVTGIVDPDESLRNEPASGGRELQLILCGNQDGRDVCLRERFELRPSGNGFEVSLLEDSGPEIGSPAPTLDPPLGVRSSWLDAALAKHSFVVLVFYRGFW